LLAPLVEPLPLEPPPVLEPELVEPLLLEVAPELELEAVELPEVAPAELADEPEAALDPAVAAPQPTSQSANRATAQERRTDMPASMSHRNRVAGERVDREISG